MLLKIIHETDLSYSSPIDETVMELRMAPRQEQDQHRLSFRLAIGPATPVTGYFDWLGNLVHSFTINSYHERIKIVATSVVETHRALSDATILPDRWPLNLDELDYAVRDFLRFGVSVVECPALQSLADSMRATPGMSLGTLAMSMLQMLDEKFTYEKGVTHAASPITEILEHRRGVCQDFTHLMIGLARSLGIPSRYVSGFLHPEGEKYRGYSQTHAWCELFFPSVGWVGFDPTNKCMITSHFVRVAVGREYRDVPPNRGMYKGDGEESMLIAVQSEELGGVPGGLPAERIEGIGMRAQYGHNGKSYDPSNQEISLQQQQ